MEWLYALTAFQGDPASKLPRQGAGRVLTRYEIQRLYRPVKELTIILFIYAAAVGPWNQLQSLHGQLGVYYGMVDKVGLCQALEDCASGTMGEQASIGKQFKWGRQVLIIMLSELMSQFIILDLWIW